MKTLRKSGAEMLSAGTQRLTERDYEPVRTLIDEVRRRQNTANAVTTWLNAFTIFKQLEKRVGMPGASDRDYYLDIVLELRAMGHRIAHVVNAAGIDLEKEAEIRPSAFRACLKELELDAGAVDFAADPEAVARFERYFAAK
jgi:hypothetical protein